MTTTEFKSQMDKFLAPVIDILKTRKPKCEVHWIYPNEPERNTCTSWPAEEVQHYLTSMISDGFLASVRFGTTSSGALLQITLWEEWEGGFRGAHWPASGPPAEFEAVWSGYTARD